MIGAAAVFIAGAGISMHSKRISDKRQNVVCPLSDVKRRIAIGLFSTNGTVKS
jgi:hypothetical protein